MLTQLNFAEIFIGFLVLVFSLSVHESAHAWTASRLGDQTGRVRGRVSLNPAVHADPFGTILFPLLAMVTRLPLIGWAKPVPVDFRNLRNPRRDFMLIAAAGPASNLVLAVIASVAMRLGSFAPNQFGSVHVAGPLSVLVSVMLAVNLLLAIFNMIPVPPLDGGNVLAGLLPDRAAAVFDNLRPYGFVILYALMLTGGFTRLVGPPYRLLLSWLI